MVNMTSWVIHDRPLSLGGTPFNFIRLRIFLQDAVTHSTTRCQHWKQFSQTRLAFQHKLGGLERSQPQSTRNFSLPNIITVCPERSGGRYCTSGHCPCFRHLAVCGAETVPIILRSAVESELPHPDTLRSLIPGRLVNVRTTVFPQSQLESRCLTDCLLYILSYLLCLLRLD